MVLTGAGGKAFVSGADISRFGDERANEEAVARYNATTEKANSAVHEFPKPTIAMIRGYCIGGGLGLAVCCDLRICGDNSRFAVPAAKLGLGYGYAGLKRLVDVVGPSFAREIFFTARQFDAAEAREMGLVNRVVPDGEVEVLCQELRGHDRRQCPADGQLGQVHRRRDGEGREQARPQALRRHGGAVLRQQRLCRGARGVHGEAQAGLHRDLTDTLNPSPEGRWRAQRAGWGQCSVLRHPGRLGRGGIAPTPARGTVGIR